MLQWNWMEPKNLEDELDTERIFNKFFDMLEHVVDPLTQGSDMLFAFESTEDMAKLILTGVEISEVLIKAYADVCSMMSRLSGGDDYTPISIVKDIRNQRPRIGYEGNTGAPAAE